MIEYEKQGCLWPILHSHKGSFGPINLSWLQEAGDRLKIRVRTTQEEVSPPAFLGAHLTCLHYSYTGINGRRRKISPLFAKRGAPQGFFRSG